MTFLSSLPLRLRRAWCALTHEMEPYRGGVRCRTCQPEIHRRKAATPDIDPRQQPLIEPEREMPA